MKRIFAFALLPAFWLCQASAEDLFQTEHAPIVVETVATGLEHPWGVEILPDGAYLVTERPGGLRIIKDGNMSAPFGMLPGLAVGGQGGLLDVALANDFAKTGTLFLSFSQVGSGGAGTAIARAQLVREAGEPRLDNVEVIFSMPGKTGRGQHFGSRIAVAQDDSLYFSIGDRGDSDRAQDMNDHAGAILRIRPDGSIPHDNPFSDGKQALPELWSKGHRNPQGMDIDRQSGVLYTVEHGARGGDEINQPKAGENYGWPVISYGRHYSGAKIGVGTKADGYEQPIYYWDPSIAPGGMAVYRGDMFPEWDGNFLVAALKDQMLVRLDRAKNGTVVGEERLFPGEYGRIREVKTAPDGSIILLTDETDGAILRIRRQ
jgi:glucose/arabinose dehydrogenase